MRRCGGTPPAPPIRGSHGPLDGGSATVLPCDPRGVAACRRRDETRPCPTHRTTTRSTPRCPTRTCSRPSPRTRPWAAARGPPPAGSGTSRADNWCAVRSSASRSDAPRHSGRPSVRRICRRCLFTKAPSRTTRCRRPRSPAHSPCSARTHIRRCPARATTARSSAPVARAAAGTRAPAATSRPRATCASTSPPARSARRTAGVGRVRRRCAPPRPVRAPRHPVRGESRARCARPPRPRAPAARGAAGSGAGTARAGDARRAGAARGQVCARTRCAVARAASPTGWRGPWRTRTRPPPCRCRGPTGPTRSASGWPPPGGGSRTTSRRTARYPPASTTRTARPWRTIWAAGRRSCPGG